MHEVSIAQNIITLVLESVEKKLHKDIKAVKVTIGSLSGVIPESLLFCYDTLKHEYGLKDSTLEIDNIQAEAECNNCGNRFNVIELFFVCEKCGGSDIKFICGDELKVTEIIIK